jgi:hypothetical protein
VRRTIDASRPHRHAQQNATGSPRHGIATLGCTFENGWVTSRYPTAVQALLALDVETNELRLTIATNTGRPLEEWSIYGSPTLDAGVQQQVDEHLDRSGLRRGDFEGDERAGWKATVQSRAIDPDAATD